jgi:hypothetical protein
MKNLKMGILIIFLICSLCIAGCVAPPKPGSSSSSSTPGSSQSDTGQGVSTSTTTPSFVTIETPYQTPTSDSFPRTQIPVATPTPDEYIQIYSTTQYFSWNATAVSFNLTKPPMIIDFAVTPVNLTGTKITTSKSLSKEEITVTYDYFSPYSWLEITVREKNTGRILNKEGFGSYKQYSDDTGREVPRKLRIMQPGNLLIEMSGNQITANMNVSVIKTGNIN